MTRRQRSRESFRRRRPSVAPRACVLLVCEGEKTEPHYFKSLRKELRLTTLEVEIVGQGAAPKTVVKKAVELARARKQEVRLGRDGLNYDYVWCVFDVEQRCKNPSLQPALKQAVDNGVDVALSNPCFEYWFLIHFTECGKAPVNCEGVVRELHKHLPNYAKAQDVFGRLWPGVDNAIRRAKAREDSHCRAGTSRIEMDPSTEVYRVVELLRKTVARPS